jgi:hypothetical protein
MKKEHRHVALPVNASTTVGNRQVTRLPPKPAMNIPEGRVLHSAWDSDVPGFRQSPLTIVGDPSPSACSPRRSRRGA